MGRKSRKKRERRERGDGPVAALVEGFASESLIPLLEAASVSPTGAHRGPSIASLFHAVAQRRRDGPDDCGCKPGCHIQREDLPSVERD